MLQCECYSILFLSSVTGSKTECCHLKQNHRYRLHQWNKGVTRLSREEKEKKKRGKRDQCQIKVPAGSDEIWMRGLALRTSFLTHYAPLLRNASRLAGLWQSGANRYHFLVRSTGQPPVRNNGVQLRDARSSLYLYVTDFCVDSSLASRATSRETSALGQCQLCPVSATAVTHT
jgi:hypothetical protein